MSILDDYRITDEEYRRMEACILEAVPTAVLRHYHGVLQWWVANRGDDRFMRRVARKAAALAGTPAMCEACFKLTQDDESRWEWPHEIGCADVRRPPFAEDCGIERPL